MIDPIVLEKYGSTQDRIRRVFTAEEGDPDYEHRERFEKRISSRVYEGIRQNLRNYRLFAASDLAWDSSPITGETVPLMQYAQGRIKFERLKDEIKKLPKDTQDKICERDPKTKEIKDVNLSKFHEVWVNLIRSFITRRTAALSAKYHRMHPFFRYEPFSTSYVAKLRADVLSQRVEMMVNQYGYRHELVQTIRDELLYGHAVEFPGCAWDRRHQIFQQHPAEGMDTEDRPASEIQTESRIVREGLPFVRPHPSRVFYDNAHALSSINTDTGCQWIGHWDVARYGDINRPPYFNREAVGFTERWRHLYHEFLPFFEQYFDCRITFPRPNEDLAAVNDRLNSVGWYGPDRPDEHVVFTEYREKIIPRDEGLGDYPHPVWIRLVVAGDKTVIYGEFLPSLPAVYYGYNENDSRQFNIAFAHEIMPWQDQVSNLLTQLLITQKTGLIKIISANIDVLPESMLKDLREIVESGKLYTAPVMLEWEASKLQELGIDTQNLIQLHEAKSLEDVTTFFRSVIQLLSLAERVLNFSAQEQGQVAPRETSATEQSIIRETTETMYDFHSLGVDEGNAAKKRVIYEALMAHGSPRVRVPVKGRYTPDTIRRAGFEFVDEDHDNDVDEAQEAASGTSQQLQHATITGNKRLLIYDWNFSSRDGGDRPSNTHGAEVAMQLVAQLVGLEVEGRRLIDDLGREQLYKLVTEIFRLADPGLNINLETAPEQPAEDGAQQPDPGPTLDEQQMRQQVVEIAQRLKVQEDLVNRIAEAVLPDPVQPSPRPPPDQATPRPADPFSPEPVGPPSPPAFDEGELP